MNVLVEKNFEKDLKRIKDSDLRKRIADAIDEIQQAKMLSQVPGVKPMTGHKGFYRLRVGNYRIGIWQIDITSVMLMRVLHRKEIYDSFPPK